MSTSTPDRPTAATSVAPSPKRRRFLFALGASGAGAAAAVAAPAMTATAAVVPTAEVLPAGRPGGYRETEHVRDYYDTTRL